MKYKSPPTFKNFSRILNSSNTTVGGHKSSDWWYFIFNP